MTIRESRRIQTQAWASEPFQFLERRVLLLFVCVSLLYFGVTLVLASTRLLWNDELFTWYTALRPSLRDVWTALLTGAEKHPPLFYVFTRGSIALFGLNAVSLRLPETMGFWIMSASLFWFVRSRTSAAYGLIAMLFPMVTGALFYAYEARPYALVLGFSGLGLLCWQRATESQTPGPWRVGLALCLAAAVSCHYFATLCFVPFVLAEGMRSITRRRIDAWMWVAFGAGLVPLVFLFPLARAAQTFSSVFWSRASWTMPLSVYRGLLYPAALALFIVPVIVAVYLSIRSDDRAPAKRVLTSFPLHELTAVVAFLCIPIIGIVIAKIFFGVFNYRYGLTAVLGLSIAFAYSVWVLAERSARAALLSVMILGASFLVQGVSDYRQLASEARARAALYSFLRSHAGGELPLVISDPHLFFEVSHEAAQLHDETKFLFLADVPLGIHYTNTDDVERGLLTMKQWAPLDVRDFHQFCSTHNQFLVFGHGQFFSWVPSELFKQGWSLTVAAQAGDQFLYRVTRR